VYRDDHEAALARVAALEDEIARDAVNDEAREARLAGLERELVTARKQLETAKAELAKLRPEPAEPKPPAKREPITSTPQPPSAQPWIPIALAVGVLVLIIVAFAISRSSKARRVPAPEPVQTSLPDEVSRLIDEGRARADKLMPGAFLTRIDAKGVTEQGSLHPEFGELELEFRHENPRPPKPEVDPNLPIGAPRPPEPEYHRWSCVDVKRVHGVWEDLDLRDMCSIYGANERSYSDVTPKCTMRSVWVRARAAGAPANAIAHIELDGGSWSFDIADDRAAIKQSFDDNCVPAAKP
jgi:hypothetical protein